MKSTLQFLLVLLLIATAVLADDKKKPEQKSNPIGVSIGLPFIPVEEDFHRKVRDKEYEAQKLEIEIQRANVLIEQDKQKQKAIWDGLSRDIAIYGKDHKIDGEAYDFDADAILFQQRTKPKVVIDIPPDPKPEKKK